MKLGQSLSSKLKKSLSNSIDLKCLRIWLTGLTESSLKKQLGIRYLVALLICTLRSDLKGTL